MTVARRTLISLAAVCASGLPTASASAQSGVVVDPGSPSGKEYAIPLDSARRDAAPGAGQGGSGSAPLFGEGVGESQAEPSTPAGTKPRPDGEKSQRESRRPGTASQPSDVDENGSGETVRQARPVAAALPSDDSNSTLTVAAVAFSVLLLGGVIGSIARRRGPN